MSLVRSLRTLPDFGRRMPILAMPYAGGGDGCFDTWQRHLSPTVELFTVRLPGRLSRFGDPLPTSLDGLAADLVDDLGPHLDGVFVLFGHSMGALLAFEFAHALHRRHGIEPACLIVSGLPAPDRLETVPRLSHLPDDELRAVVAGIGQTHDEVLDDPELWSIIGPTLRQDFANVDTYVLAARTPLSCPIVAYAGHDDIEVPRQGLEAWRSHTTGPFRSRIFDGGHFFFETAPDAFAAELDRHIDRVRHA